MSKSKLSLSFPGLGLGLDLPGKDIMGTYAYFLTNSLTPQIGTLTSSVGFSVVANKLEVAAGASGNLTFSGLPSTKWANDSFIWAFSVAASVAGDTPSIQIMSSLGETVDPNINFGVPGSVLFTSTHLGNGTGAVADIPLNTNNNFVIAVDAVTLEHFIYVNGILAEHEIGASGLATAAAKNQFICDATLTTGAIDFTNIHYINFIGSSLPSNIGQIANTFNASPSSKLSAFAN